MPPLIVSDLLEKGRCTDKHFFLPQTIQFDRGVRLAKVFLNSNDTLVKLNEKIEGDIPTIKEVVARRSKTGDDVYNKMLISGGAVLGLGKDWESAEIVFLKRSFGAPSDPGYLTMPAGRMDQGMAAHCYQEMAEVLLFGSVGDKEVIFVPLRDQKMSVEVIQGDKEIIFVPLCDGLAPEDAILNFKAAALKAAVPNAENREVHFLSISEVPVAKSWSIELYLDGKLIETISNVLVAIDEPNHTLEFRQLVLLDISLGEKIFYLGTDPAKPKGVLAGVGDGEGYGCDIVIVSVASLKKYFSLLQNADADFLRSLLLKSQTPGLDITVTTVPGGGKFHKFFWNAKGVKLPFTTTVTEFVKLFI